MRELFASAVGAEVAIGLVVRMAGFAIPAACGSSNTFSTPGSDPRAARVLSFGESTHRRGGCVTWKEQVSMGNRFDAYLAGRVATKPTRGSTHPDEATAAAAEFDCFVAAGFDRRSADELRRAVRADD